jgi:hypothetical protein
LARRIGPPWFKMHAANVSSLPHSLSGRRSGARDCPMLLGDAKQGRLRHIFPDFFGFGPFPPQPLTSPYVPYVRPLVAPVAIR